MCGVTGLLRYATLGIVRGPWDDEQSRFWTARHDENHVDDKMACFLTLDDCDCGVPPKKPCPTCGIESRKTASADGVKTYRCARGHVWQTGTAASPAIAPKPPTVVTPVEEPVPTPAVEADVPDTNELEAELKSAIEKWINKKKSKK